MRKKSFSKQSAYGYQYNGAKASSYTQKLAIPMKWLLTGGVVFILLLGGLYVGINYLQTSNLQNTNEEIRNMDISITGEEKEKSDWEQSISTIIHSEDTVLNKYSRVIDMAVAYKVTEREFKQFKEDILKSYETGVHLNVNDDEVILMNIFKSYVLNEYTNIKTDLQFKLFIDNYLDTLGYVYREYETSDSEFVKDKEKIMNSALEKMQSE